VVVIVWGRVVIDNLANGQGLWEVTKLMKVPFLFSTSFARTYSIHVRRYLGREKRL